MIGYARVSSVGQSLDVQLEKLSKHGCDQVFQEKRSGTNSQRPEYKRCMQYLRKGDTLVITKLDRLARSVFELSKLNYRFNEEDIKLVVLDQNIDTSTPTGKLMFNMLATIAEFENELRRERQLEGIAKAKANNVKFGRKPKHNKETDLEIYEMRSKGATFSELVKAFNVSESSIRRSLKRIDS